MMRRLLVLFLAVFLLAGCTGNSAQSESTTEPDQEPQQPTVIANSLYDPDSRLEEATHGAVRVYDLGQIQPTEIAAIGEDILLLTGENGGSLLRLSAQKGTIEAKVPVSAGDEKLRISDRRIGYYEAASGSVVFLDGQLAETGRVALPEDFSGTPVLSPDFGTVYYSSGQQIRALDVQTGISRLVKLSEGCETRLQSCFGGEYLVCQVKEVNGDGYSCFVSTQTGETVYRDSALEWFASYGDDYLLQRGDGIVTERLFGSIGGTPQSLHLPENETPVPLLSLGGVLTSRSTDGGFTLSFYDLFSGAKTAEVTVEGAAEPYLYAPGQNGVWMAAGDEVSGRWYLYFWDLAKSAVEEKTVYTGPWYTAEDPDIRGLAECQDRADRMGQVYGVDIRTGTAAAEQLGEWELEPEYQVEALEKSLAQLELALGEYPEDFFRLLCQGTDSGILHICLVRGIENEIPGIQYWLDGDAYIALAVGNTVEQSFFHQVCHVLDTFVIAKSLAYDEWDSLNPEGFVYDYSYGVYSERDGSEYLTEPDCAFIDGYSMTYPKEDRARIMEYAMTPEHAEAFQCPILQKKLRQICTGIREAFGWEEDPRTFSWERYLEEPLADNGK